MCTSTVSLWQLEANKRWKAKRAILTVYRKRGRHREQKRLRGLDPSPSTHSLRRVTGSLKGLFSSSKHSGWKTRECGGSVSDYNRGKSGREPSARRSISQTNSSFMQKNKILQGKVPLNHTIISSFHRWKLLVYFSSSASHLKHSITIILNGPFTCNVELWEQVLWAEIQTMNCFPVIHYSWHNGSLLWNSLLDLADCRGLWQKQLTYYYCNGDNNIFFWLQCQYTIPFPIQRFIQAFSCECYKSSRLWKAKKGSKKYQHLTLHQWQRIVANFENKIWTPTLLSETFEIAHQGFQLLNLLWRGPLKQPEGKKTLWIEFGSCWYWTTYYVSLRKMKLTF